MGSLELKDVGATHEYHELLSESYATVFWDQLHKPLKFTTGPRKPLTQTHTSHHTQQQLAVVSTQNTKRDSAMTKFE